MNELAFLDKATQAIARVATIGDAKVIADQATAIKLYAAKQGWSTAQKTEIAKIELLATARLGELLREMEMNRGAEGKPGPGRGKRGARVEPRLDAPPTLADLGISKKQSSIAQKAAAIPEKKREQYIAEKSASGNVSVSGFVKAHVKEKKEPEPPLSTNRYDPQSAEDLEGLAAKYGAAMTSFLAEKRQAAPDEIDVLRVLIRLGCTCPELEALKRVLDNPLKNVKREKRGFPMHSEVWDALVAAGWHREGSVNDV